MRGKHREFLARCLEAPSYGFERDGAFYSPAKREILREFFLRLNVLATRKNWFPLFAWAVVALLGVAACLDFALMKILSCRTQPHPPLAPSPNPT